MNNLAIIPARGGSKRIPGKNIKDFLGKPIIAYTIETALASGLFSEVMVSTDDESIAAIAKKYGASVPFFRSTKNADDVATTIDVLHEVIACYNQQNKFFEYACCLYPTAPLITTTDLNSGYNHIKTEKLTSVFPVVAFSYPVWRGIELDKNNKPKLVWPEYLNSRSQDLKTVYHDAGQWYWFDPLKLGTTLFTENSKTIILDEVQVQDIDNLTDWKLAEIKFRLSYENKNIHKG